MRIEDREFLIIGGMPKAGTSSLFAWLSDHPDFQRSNVNEVRFFLDPDYPLPGAQRFDGRNLSDYLTFFPADEEGKVLLDSTPDYLYARTASQIASLLPRARIVFILRDPVERAVSCYRFFAQIARIPRGMGFEDYIAAQLETEVGPGTPIHLRALDQNRVEKYLPTFRQAFGDRCLVIDFQALTRDPAASVRSICDFCNVDPGFYEGYGFSARNVTTGGHASRAARLFFRSRAWFLYKFRPAPETLERVRPLARLLRRTVSGNRKLENVVVSDELADAIARYAKNGLSDTAEEL